MRFDIFNLHGDAHVRKAREYLQQAHLARIEHQTAAEHHAALAAMYAKRAKWLERELAGGAADVADTGSGSFRDFVPKPVEALGGGKRSLESVLSLARN